MIKFKKADIDEIIEYAKNGVPEEVCGLLGGTVDGDEKTVEKVYYIENTDHSAEHFSISPINQIKAIKDMRANGYTLLGNFHSHPNSPSRPSDEDKRLALDPSASYVILSLQNNDNVIKSFKIKDNISSEEILAII